MTFEELTDHVRAVTDLGARDVVQIALSFDETETPTSGEILRRAKELGFDVATPSVESTAPENEIEMDPAKVLAEVYLVCPQVMCEAFPSIGRAPRELEANEDLAAVLDTLPPDMRALLVKANVVERELTIWMRDEANDIDRAIGPVDLNRYDTPEKLHGALDVLIRRLPIVLRAAWN